MSAYYPVEIASNFKIPDIGLGTYQVSDEAVEALVFQALVLGYRHIDTAEGYHNEAGVGRAIQDYLKQGISSREAIFISSKLWSGNANWGQTPKGYSACLQAFNESLERLQLDYLDLYLIHAPFNKQEYIEQWHALVDLEKASKVRHIGVSNFTQQHIEDLIQAGLPKPEVNQIELHPWCQKPELVTYLKTNHILPMAYSSLVPLANWRTEPKLESAKTDKMQALSKDQDFVINRLAQEYQVTPAQLLLRWALEEGFAVIPKSLNSTHLAENLELYHFRLDDVSKQALRELDLAMPVSWPSCDPSQLSS